MHLIRRVLGGFTNIAIKRQQCFYCALDLKIEAGLTAGSRRTYGKGLVFVCLCGDEWPVSTRWLVCTIKLSKRKDFFPNSAFSWRIMEFRVVCDCGGTCRAWQGRGRRSDRVLIAASSVAQAVRGDAETNVGLFSKINPSVVVGNGYPSSDTAVRQLRTQVVSEQGPTQRSQCRVKWQKTPNLRRF